MARNTLDRGESRAEDTEAEQDLRRGAAAGLRGDKGALSELLRRTAMLVWAQICSGIRGEAWEHERQTVLNETLLSVWRALDKLADVNGSPIGLIRRIASRRILDFYEKVSRERTHQGVFVLIDDPEDTKDTAQDVAGQELVQRFRETLTAEEKTAVDLRVAGETLEAIASALGKNKGSVSRQLRDIGQKADAFFRRNSSLAD